MQRKTKEIHPKEVNHLIENLDESYDEVLKDNEILDLLTPHKGAQEDGISKKSDQKPNTKLKGGQADTPSLRPDTLGGFLGQKALKHRLGITLKAAKTRGEILPHQLLAGPPGLGKTTLAQILANEMEAEIHVTSGPSLEKPGDLAGTLLSLKEGSVLFIDEIHRLSPVVEEFLYPAMEDRKLDILIDKDGKTDTLRMDLNAFTLIGATTRPGNLSGPLRSRFQTIHKLELYDAESLTEIVEQSAQKLGCKIQKSAAEEIARRARGTPRTANNHLLWVRDYAQAIDNTTHISHKITQEALREIGIDQEGLDPTDRRILSVLVENFKGGPAGVNSLAVACGEDPGSLEDVHEPYLIAQGYLRRGPQGRVATDKTKRLFGKETQDAFL